METTIGHTPFSLIFPKTVNQFHCPKTILPFHLPLHPVLFIAVFGFVLVFVLFFAV
jgi:hypothetical protein